jgi:hypothetical protein
MKKKKIVLIILAIIILAGIAYGGYVYWQWRSWCASGGESTQYWFEKTELLKMENVANFQATKNNSIALSTYRSCEYGTDEIKKDNNNWTRVKNRDMFDSYLKGYNTKCGDCLLGEFHGEGLTRIQKYSNGKEICETRDPLKVKEDIKYSMQQGTSPDICIPLSDLK